MKKGKVTILIEKIRERDTIVLIERFKQIIGAQAIRTYMVAKKDPILDIEVRLTQEELNRRMVPKSIYKPIAITI